MAEFIKIYPENPNPKAIQKIVNVLKKGGILHPRIIMIR